MWVFSENRFIFNIHGIHAKDIEREKFLIQNLENVVPITNQRNAIYFYARKRFYKVPHFQC